VTSPILPVYARADLAFETGEGCWLTTREGERYLDFGSGVAVNALGHAHPHLVEALTAQAQKLWHTSNLYRIPEGERLARRLVENSFADRVFFCNSGAEALEASIKTARKYHAAQGRPERIRIITLEGAFHGRTLATLAAGGQQKYLEGFGPRLEGFDQVRFDDGAALEAMITPETAAILVEPIQGESGIREIEASRLRQMRELCDRHGILLVFDEVQTGIGRTGKLFAHEWSGITPDILASAKGLGGGFPVGACLTTEEAGSGMTAGTHGSTFGGNPLAMAVGNAVLDVILAPGFLEHVQQLGLLFKQRLAELKDRHPAVIAEIRGRGLMLGLRLLVPNTEFTAATIREKLLTIAAGDNVARLVPPLIVTDDEVADGLARIDRACIALENRMKVPASEEAAQ
jgi:acetylornithine/N-succinyldiaminopimelate aminotransferase